MRTPHHNTEKDYRLNDPVSWLAFEYQDRRSKNPSYSLRAFSRQIEIPVGHLSGILSRKRPLTKKMGTRIAERLGFQPSEKEQFLDLIYETETTKKDLKKADVFRPYLSGFKKIEQDEFSLIAEWYHFAILSLMETKDFRNSPKWIARRLNILPSEAEQALQRLARLRLTKVYRGKLTPNQKGVSTTTNVPCSALRTSHRQTLEQSIRALDEVSIKDSEITSITMAIDVKKIPIAKEIIKRFRRYLAKVLESGERTEVYNLNVQLVPVTKIRGEKK